MALPLIWLPDVLNDAKLKFSPVPGWENRCRPGDFGPVRGVICHHTAGSRKGNMPSLGVLLDGRPDLPGPLAQLGVGRDGTFYLVAAGRCNHAGAGSWKGITSGNTSFIGIEAENTGLADDSPWPEIQMECLQRGVAAILQHLGAGPEYCAGHKEYALPAGRKDDPDFDMFAFRSAVAGFMDGSRPARPPIPSVEPPPADGSRSPRPTLRRGAQGDLVKQIQSKCGITADGSFGPGTEAAVRAFQQARGMVPDGIVGPKTWQALDAAPG